MFEDKQHVLIPDMDLSKDNLEMKDVVVYACLKKHQNVLTGEAFPSFGCLVRESGLSKPTVMKSVARLERAGYILILKDEKVNHYRFNEYKKFEIYSFDFLNDESLSVNDKAYIICMQPHMFKDLLSGLGRISYSDFDIAKMLNIDIRTLKKYEYDIQKNHNIMTIVPSKKIDPETGLCVNERVFDFAAYNNLLCVKFQKIDDDVDSLRNENKKLWLELEKLKKELRGSKISDAEYIEL